MFVCILQSEDGDGSVHRGHGARGHDPRCPDGFLWNSPRHLFQRPLCEDFRRERWNTEPCCKPGRARGASVAGCLGSPQVSLTSQTLSAKPDLNRFGNILASCSYDRRVLIWQENQGQWTKVACYDNLRSIQLKEFVYFDFPLMSPNLAIA